MVSDGTAPLMRMVPSFRPLQLRPFSDIPLSPPVEHYILHLNIRLLAKVILHVGKPLRFLSVIRQVTRLNGCP